MLETMEFPENKLFYGDAGFVGYDFWNTIDKWNLCGHLLPLAMGRRDLPTIAVEGIIPDRVKYKR